ncbi:kinase-like domain-containing protein [Syncephalis fuscata]|nr:kinase-like domain-containing protein [Syncephalis fuscata]
MSSQDNNQTSTFASTSAALTPAAVAAELPPNLLCDEDLMYYNVPDCWNDLPREERVGIVAWAEVCEATSSNIVLLKTRPYYFGTDESGSYLNVFINSYRLVADSMPKYCFNFLVNNDIVTCMNIRLPNLIVNGTELRALESKNFTGDCIIKCQKRNLTPVQVEDSLEYEEKINARFMITDKSIGKSACCIKISKKERGIDAFNHEVSVLRRVGNHSNVIKLLDDKITALNTYLFLEYAAGGDLIDYIISKSALPEMEAKHIFKQLLEGIEYLHSKDVVHYGKHTDLLINTITNCTLLLLRSLLFRYQGKQPDNVLLLDGQECPRVVFADFGMARPLLSSPTVTAAYGTVSYMAPEVLLGSDEREKIRLPSALLDAKGYGKPADIWSLGATLHTMLLGNWPYGSTNNQSVYMRTILQHSPTFGQEKANGPSKQAVQLMKRLLDLDSGTRYTAKQALDSSWFDDGKEQIDAAIPFDATSPSQEEPAVSTTPITQQ